MATGRIGLSPPAFRLHELACRERRRGEIGEVFATPVERVLRECEITLPELAGVVCELELGGLCEVRANTQGVLVLRVVKPMRIASPVNRFRTEAPEVRP